MPKKRLSHVDRSGRARMVDVSPKGFTSREARARGRVALSKAAVAAIRAGKNAKGDAIEVARLAGILAAKKTPDLIPLCHPLRLDHVDVRASLTASGVEIEASVRARERTGAEMEALTAVAVAALTVFDMCKAVDPWAVIADIRVEEKVGGKRGHMRRDERK